MATMPGSLDVADLARERLVLRVRLERAREFRARSWLLARLLWLAGKVSPVDMDVELADRFKPCVIEHKDLGLTEMLLADCQVVWSPFGTAEHFLDLGYDQDGNLVGVQVWANVGTREALVS